MKPLEFFSSLWLGCWQAATIFTDCPFHPKQIRQDFGKTGIFEALLVDGKPGKGLLFLMVKKIM